MIMILGVAMGQGRWGDRGRASKVKKFPLLCSDRKALSGEAGPFPVLKDTVIYVNTSVTMERERDGYMEERY